MHVRKEVGKSVSFLHQPSFPSRCCKHHLLQVSVTLVADCQDSLKVLHVVNFIRLISRLLNARVILNQNFSLKMGSRNPLLLAFAASVVLIETIAMPFEVILDHLQ